jgi:REP element-mobilizing transposase RayT
MQRFVPGRTTWHITWGTYGARLHGGERPTVDRDHNRPHDAVIGRDERRERFERSRMGDRPPVLLTDEQRSFIEATVPQLCERGGWSYRIGAAGPERDHVHVLRDAPPHVHGTRIRRWLKTWLTEALDVRWSRPPAGRWWAECGSTKTVKDDRYLNNAFIYIRDQRATPFS